MAAVIAVIMNAMFDDKCDYECARQKTSEDFEIDYEFLKKNRSVIEYIDTDEADTIALKTNINEDDKNEKFSHCEIHSSLIMGFVILAGALPNSVQHISSWIWPTYIWHGQI